VGLQRVFVITGIDRVIPSVTTLAEALAKADATANGRSRPRKEEDDVPKNSRRGPAPASELPPP
jgi:hypothetical protein